MYTNMSIVDASRTHPYGDTPSPKRFGMVSPLDPQLFAGVDEYAKTLLEGEALAKYSPVEVAQWMDALADAAAKRLREAQKQIADRNEPAFRRLAVDVTIQSGLGRFFAAKLRAGVLYAIYDRTGAPPALAEALKAYRAARAAWVEMAAAAQKVYVEDVTFGLETQSRGHWQDRLAALDEDIADMEKRAQSKPAEGQAGAVYSDAVRRFVSGSDERTVNVRPVVPLVHVIPPLFVVGQPLTVELTLLSPPASVASVRLCYRRVHQALPYQSAEMASQGHQYRATIPGDYTDTPYPLEYYFELRNEAGQAWLYPGFDATLTNQPYFVVRQG
jgi:hypothetical protein